MVRVSSSFFRRRAAASIVSAAFEGCAMLIFSAPAMSASAAMMISRLLRSRVSSGFSSAQAFGAYGKVSGNRLLPSQRQLWD